MEGQSRISLEELRRSLGRVARTVEGGRAVVVERRGEEAFALVPMRLYRFLEEERRKLLQATEEARGSFSDMSGEEVEALVAAELEEASSTERKASSARRASS